ncbi:hypothetical protein FXO38_02968 [Capsicum annuum]|uniref:Uncharacterized protein n=1 Tax=Capsicum annuum TaxID=4072 RepID=A0A2G3AHZ4_CAPAN|nr:hypothetical protein FXO38_02968 [Capsicum annuum]KAF3681112.1 hypothetical protein FXO37_03040 [Capsicum annuum]PHT93820.1 hypothetical protein T459_01702 [Capsicum annuum]
MVNHDRLLQQLDLKNPLLNGQLYKVVYIDSPSGLFHFFFHMSGRLLDERQILSIVDEIKQVLSDILSLKLEREERTKAEYFDAEASDLIEIDEEEDLFHCILTYFSNIIIYLIFALHAFVKGKDKTAEKREVAIDIFNSFSNHCPLEACNDESTDIRLGVAYGLSICAEHGGSVLNLLLEVNKTYSFPDIKNNFISEALSQLTMAIRHPNALQPDNVMAYDNAVSALGSSTGEDLASEQTISRMINLLRQLRQTLPAACLTGFNMVFFET